MLLAGVGPVGPVGTVGVSGLPQVADHAFVVAELARFLGVDDELESRGAAPPPARGSPGGNESAASSGRPSARDWVSKLCQDDRSVTFRTLR